MTCSFVESMSFMKTRLSLIVLLTLWSLVAIVRIAMAATGYEYIWTDEPQYLKGDTARIFGTGFSPYTPILIKVTRPDGSIVTGDGTETPGSDTIVTNVDGNFAYTYMIDGIQAEGTYTVEAIDTAPDPDVILASTSFLDTAQFLLQGCSWSKGDCTQAALPAWADGATPMDGWTSGVLKGWFELEYVPYRLRINLPKPGDAGTYYITNEHDNLRSGIPGVDDTAEFYVGKQSDGTLTKSCTFQTTRAVGDNPTSLNPCIVAGDTYTGVNDDPSNDSNIDEETTNGIDNDSDGLVDEDPAGSYIPAGKIQDTWAVLFDPSEAGSSNSKWALYWKAHLALGSSGFPGATLHADTTTTGAQDVPIKNVQPSPPPADLFINKSYTGTPSPGKTLTFTLQYGNTGGANASNVVITDDYDEDYIIPSNICCGGIDDGDKITWNIGMVAAGSGPFAVTYDGKIHDGTPDTTAHMPIGITHVVNIATISTTSIDADLSDNISTVDILVDAEPNLFVTKTVNSNSQALVQAGDTVTITLTYGNSDNNDAPNVTLCDDYNQTYLAPISSTISPGGVDDGDKICWGLTADTLPGVIPGTRTLPGIDPQVGYQANVIDNPAGWTDPATITTSDPEPGFKLANNTSAVQFSVSKPTAIRLSSFNASHTMEDVLISWTTGTEIDTEGFNILRSISPGDPYRRITPSMIEATGSAMRGGKYSFVDREVEKGRTYYYKLEEVDVRGKRVEYGPVAVVAGEVEMSDPAYTIVLYGDGHARFLSGEVVDLETVQWGTNGERSKDRHPPFGVSTGLEAEITPNLSVPRHLIRHLIRGEGEMESGLKSDPSQESIHFRIIDVDGNEVAVASLDATPNPPIPILTKGGIEKQLDGERVILTWYATVPVKGFHILRSTKKEGIYRRITRTLIPHLATSTSDPIFCYTYTDTTVEKGKDYNYKLETVYNDGIKTSLRKQ